MRLLWNNSNEVVQGIRSRTGNDKYVRSMRYGRARRMEDI